ncbi:Ubiquitin-like-specific protease ESD4 [Apostasia shenzhenica]|uniref:Ubiquitin-like-specific protease ESD4 n=1 Tax=Apostasia shenzhenica TaxID=1088818 RepID=A0A2I0B371_9ASPA|nr:Ubiquitin-like-specific protease ESD4 [Apostasia shenzhenica]
MGNFFSQFFCWKRDDGIALEEYKKLEEGRCAAYSDQVAELSSPRANVCFRPASDLTILFRKEEIFGSSHVLNRKVEDARKVALEWMPAREESVKSEPRHKELHQKAKVRDARFNELDLDGKLRLQKITGFRIEAKLLQEREENPAEFIKHVFRPLTVEEEEVFRALSCGSSNEVLVRHEPSNIVLTRKALQCLCSGAWLNDEVINLYLELLKERERRDPKKFLQCHFFSTFFYKRLTNGSHGYDFKTVKRWTAYRKLGYALIDCDRIFVPIHNENHWCLAIIDVKGESFLYLDSLGGTDDYALEVLAQYLRDEFSDKSAKEIDTSSWRKEPIDELPMQKNWDDCGMFMLKYTDFYSRGLHLCFTQEHIPYFRMRTAIEILQLTAE